jgi:hypothetical protein
MKGVRGMVGVTSGVEKDCVTIGLGIYGLERVDAKLGVPTILLESSVGDREGNN